MRRGGHGCVILGAIVGLCVVAPATATAVPFQRGVTVGEWGESAYAPGATKRVLARLVRRQHVDAVTLFAVWEQRDATSISIRPDERTARTSRLRKAIRAARRLGLRVVLRPYIDRKDNGWRGRIAPASVPRWFASYRRFVLKFASLAQREHAHGFVVGSEMVSLSGLEARWRQLVREVRSRFRGFVTYQANWDEADRIAWWDELDAISISAYYPISVVPSPSVQELVRGWTEYRNGPQVVRRFDGIKSLAERYRKPVVFGEIGYRPLAGSAARPWDVAFQGGSSTATQANAYEAAFQVWYRVPWFRGFHWWYVSPQPALVRGRPGADHRPRTRAVRVLAKWYKRAR